MNRYLSTAAIILLGGTLVSCGDGGPSNPTPTTTTTAPAATTVPASRFQITTLLTVYRSAPSFAEFTEGTTDDENIGEILLGVDELTPGTTLLDNELLRRELQQAIDRVNDQFSDDDWAAAFDETRQNLRRFFDDADNDGWSVDGRHGEGRDWPHDSDGNDPNGWTAQMVVTVTRR